jgi:hypothetical protein
MVRSLVWLGLVACLLVVAYHASGDRASWAQLSPNPTPASGPRDDSKPPERRFREGTHLVDRIGRFKVATDRVTFSEQEDELEFPTLENLALERVARIVSDSSGELQWSVSGTVTEFRGQNYLLITRALLKAEATTE